jgi:hypothetical protein
LLYGIVDIAVKRKTGKVAPTLKACEWIKSRRRNLSPRKAQDMNFKKSKTESTSNTYSVSDKKKPNLSLPLIQDFKQILEKINPTAGWLKKISTVWQSAVPTSRQEMPPTSSYRDNVDLFSDECTEHFKNISSLFMFH